ncbi:chorismate mutase [Saccharothrix violaceirubra]|uniref:Chorismate mutase n=1 Tax=Saccharothrix violaceirubra TaxID=413306 RepID=A0A7W7SYP5_9PSEU|nr:chorismate mutase [Saccharothrix violaceirubra]MBB4963295.1 chorismate mutase [Saccharothrix violaceirubra]
MTEPRSLTETRSRIDTVDSALIRLLADRQELVRTAAAFKKDEQDVRAPDRVAEVIALARSRAEEAGLSPDVAESVWRAMITAFVDLELAEHSALRRN